MGVAVITRRSAASPFGAERQALTHAEAMLLVDDGEAEIGEGDALLKQRVGADDNVDLARSPARRASRAARRLVAAGEQGNPQARAFGELAPCARMLAGEHFGRRHHRRLPPRLDDLGHCEQRDDRLARADIALQQPHHALFGAARSARISSTALPLRAGQRERQRARIAGRARPRRWRGRRVRASARA